MKTHFKAQKLRRQGHYFGVKIKVVQSARLLVDKSRKINQSLFSPCREGGRRDGS